MSTFPCTSPLNFLCSSVRPLGSPKVFFILVRSSETGFAHYLTLDTAGFYLGHSWSENSEISSCFESSQDGVRRDVQDKPLFGLAFFRQFDC